LKPQQYKKIHVLLVLYKCSIIKRSCDFAGRIYMLREFDLATRAKGAAMELWGVQRVVGPTLYLV
jgi:hypothetical protein